MACVVDGCVVEDRDVAEDGWVVEIACVVIVGTRTQMSEAQTSPESQAPPWVQGHLSPPTGQLVVEDAPEVEPVLMLNVVEIPVEFVPEVELKVEVVVTFAG